MSKFIPSLTSSWTSDLPAGIVVFLVALPLCLGVALASGAPLFSGIIAGVVGGILVAAFSGSALSVSGPAAGLTTIVLSSIQTLGSFEVFLLAVFLAGSHPGRAGGARLRPASSLSTRRRHRRGSRPG